MPPRWVRHTCRPSTYQVTDWPARLQSMVYVWNDLVHANGPCPHGPAPPLPMPFFSLQTFGPCAGSSQPQCIVCQVRLMPLMLSMMSISPTIGQFHRLPR